MDICQSVINPPDEHETDNVVALFTYQEFPTSLSATETPLTTVINKGGEYSVNGERRDINTYFGESGGVIEIKVPAIYEVDIFVEFTNADGPEDYFGVRVTNPNPGPSFTRRLWMYKDSGLITELAGSITGKYTVTGTGFLQPRIFARDATAALLTRVYMDITIRKAAEFSNVTPIA